MADQEREENQKWVELREGIKLRNILQSSKMVGSGINLVSGDRYNLVLNRKLGYEKLISDCGWQVLTNGEQDWVLD